MDNGVGYFSVLFPTTPPAHGLGHTIISYYPIFRAQMADALGIAQWTEPERPSGSCGGRAQEPGRCIGGVMISPRPTVREIRGVNVVVRLSLPFPQWTPEAC